MNKQCLKCVQNNTEINCYQCYLISEYNKKAKNEFSRFLNFILFGFWVIAGFMIINFILIKQFLNVEFGLSFGFFGLCLCFTIYCIPIKKKKD
jgi:FtsH-binding integral membrane protein